MLWSVGASLFAIAVTGLSVSYFDQSILFVYLVIGILGTMSSVLASLPPVQPAPARPVAPIPAPRSDIRHRRFI
jgi:hypothetical protein